MKTNKIGSYAFIAMAIVGTLLIAGCPSPGDDGPVKFSGLIYGDTFSSALAAPQHWEHTNGLVTTPEKTETYNNSAESYKVDWSSATGGTGLAIHMGSGTTLGGTTDLSTYNALTFWAKATANDAQVKFGLGGDDPKINAIGTRYEVWLADQALSTTWTKYIIPLPNPAKLTEINNLFYAWDGDGGNGGDTIYLDDIKFEKLASLAVSSLTHSGGAMTIQGTGAIVDLSAEFTADGKTISNVGATNLAAYVDWVSSAPAVATVDEVGLITRVSDGTATITGTLGTQTVTIAVTTQAVSAFTGVLYADAVQGGFSINKDANGGATNVTIDPAFSVDSQTAIKATLAAGTTLWGGFFFERSSGVDISGKDLKFSVLKTSLDTPSITALGVKLQDTQGAHPAQDHHFEIDLFNQSFTKTANGNWYDFSIPVLAFNNNSFDATDFNILGFWNPKKDDSGSAVLATGDFVFDNIRFEASTATSFTVTYNSNGSDAGTLSKTTDTVTEGSSATAAPTGITKAGFILTGWNTASDGTGDDFEFGTTPVTGDITLYAKWTTAYTVTYDANGGSGTPSPASDTVAEGATIAMAPTGITRAGYTLSGWNLAAAGNSHSFEFGTTIVTAEYTLYAQWTASYTVTYDVNTGSGTLSKSTDTVADGASVAEAPTGITKTGFTLSGWNTATDGSGTDFEFGTTTVTGDITLYAKWATFTGVIYGDELQKGFMVDVASDGSAAIVSDSTDSTVGGSGTSIKISQTGGTWGGGFVQYDAGVDASSYNKIQFSIDVSSLDNTVDYMEIKFEDVGGAAKSYNLYDLTETATNSDWKTYTFFTSAITGVDFAKFKHLGFWHPKAGGSAGTFTPGTFYVDDVKFISDGTTPTTYTVSYDANGSDGGALSKTTDPATEGLSLSGLTSTIAAAPTGITKTGHTLSSWNTAADGSGDEFVFGTTPVTGSIALYAQWTVITYTVTYDANGADGGSLSKATDTVDHGSSVATAPTGITRAGFTLSSWNTAVDGTGAEFEFGTTPVTGAITLYAQWTADSP